MAETDPAAALIASPLHERQVAAGAKFAPFGGWSMPLEYAGGGVLAEHAAVRARCRAVRRQPPRQGGRPRAGRRSTSSTGA